MHKLLGSTTLKIKKLTPVIAPQARYIIEKGLSEYFPDFDPTYNFDIQNLYTEYGTSPNVFLTGFIEDQMVCTGGFQLRSPSLVEIRRVSVLKEWRRHGFGERIVSRLEMYAKRDGHQEIQLETTATWMNVVKFYRSLNYQIIDQHDGNYYFSKYL